MNNETIDLIELFKQSNDIDKRFLSIAKTKWLVEKYSINSFDKRMLESLSRDNLISIIEERLDNKLKDLLERFNK